MFYDAIDLVDFEQLEEPRAQSRSRFNPRSKSATHRISLAEPTWRTRDGQDIPLNKLESSHLQNIERMLRGEGETKTDPNHPVVRRWRVLIRDEMETRGLEPLPAFMSYADALRVLKAGVEHFGSNYAWPEEPDDDRHHHSAMVKALPVLEEAVARLQDLLD